VQLAIDGQKLGGPLDLYNDGVTTTETALGTAALDTGTHVLSIEIVGATRAQKRHVWARLYQAGESRVKRG
jgi:hypothetical protein